MIIFVGQHRGNTEIVAQEADNLSSLSLRIAADVSNATIDSALADIGSPDGDHAWLDIEAIRAMCGPQTAEWHGKFDGMIAYADGKGWVRSNAVRLHLKVDDAKREEETVRDDKNTRSL